MGCVDHFSHLNFELIKQIFQSCFWSFHLGIGKIVLSLILWVYLSFHDLSNFSDDVAICMSNVIASTNLAYTTWVHRNTVLLSFTISKMTIYVTVLFIKALSSVASGHIWGCGLRIPLVFWKLIGKIFVVVDFVSVMHDSLDVFFDVLSFANSMLDDGSCINNLVVQGFLGADHLLWLS